jgi:parvulin-like peptidyl-prolyl isomerase
MPNEPEHRPVLHTRKHIARLQRERQQTGLILIAFITILVAVLGLLAYAYLDQRYFQLRRPVAKVADVEITTRQFEARVRLQQRQLFSNYNQYLQWQQFGLDVSAQLQQIQTQLDQPELIGSAVLDQLIDEELIRQETDKRGIAVSDAEIDRTIEANFDFFPFGTPTATITPTVVISPTAPAAAFAIVTRTPTASPTLPPTSTQIPTTTPGIAPAVTAAASATATDGPTPTAMPTATPLTREGFEVRLDQATGSLANMGFSLAEYRLLFKTLLLRERLQDVITADIAPVQEQVWARHILVEEEVIAAAVRDRLLKGEDFAAVAREVSKDPASAEKGGDLGWFARGVMVDSFEQVAFLLEPGYISDPVQSDFGWHIIQVIARQERPYTHEEYRQAKEVAFAKWLQNARQEYNVQTYDFWKDRQIITSGSLASGATQAVAAGQTAQAEAARRPSASPAASP